MVMLFQGMPVFIVLIFAIVFATILFRIIRGVCQWSSNNHSPVLTVDAEVVAKREHVSTYHHSDIAGPNQVSAPMTSSSTAYYATFEAAGGERMELRVSPEEYGMLAEHDRGRLTYQGTRFLEFERGA